MNSIVDFFRGWVDDYRDALPVIIVAVVVALAVMGFQRFVRGQVRQELDDRDKPT